MFWVGFEVNRSGSGRVLGLKVWRWTEEDEDSFSPVGFREVGWLGSKYLGLGFFPISLRVPEKLLGSMIFIGFCWVSDELWLKFNRRMERFREAGGHAKEHTLTLSIWVVPWYTIIWLGSCPSIWFTVYGNLIQRPSSDRVNSPGQFIWHP